MTEQEPIDTPEDDVEGHRVMGGSFGDETVPPNSADSRPPRRAVPAEDEDDVEGHSSVMQTGRPPHEMDRRRD